ncbi:cAMP-dependent protein kinase regulator [Aureococcus anophagefferens]|uniref:cGMP-dependent protein kinase n=1 Tax=Aureococcus anophagefferens TaxID=44056 RepID=A0ABR1G6P8_AURAN
MGLGSAPTTRPELGRRESRRKSQDGRENRAARPHAIADADATALDEHFVKTVIPKKESAQAIILEALQNSTLFKDMEHDQRVDVMLAMDKMSVRAGQDLIRQGEPGNAFYVIEKGEFDIVIDGCRVTTFRRGGSFGEVALIREQPRAATVTAITSAVCWRLERSLFRKYVANTTASTIDQIVRDFRQAQLLKDLPLPHLTKLATHTSLEHFETGTRVIAKDEFGDKFYVIREGPGGKQTYATRLQYACIRTVSTYFFDCEGRVRCSNIGKVSRRDSQSTSRAGEKPAYVDLGKGAHFGERALLRDEMRACDVIALEPTACYVVSRADFNAMLGSMTEAMERCVARDRGAASALREPDVFEQLERKIYKAGDCLSPNVASLKKVVVVASGVVDVRGGAPGLRQLAGLFLGRRVLRTGDLLGWQALSDEPADAASPAERATKAAQSLFWRAYASTDVVCYELDAAVVLKKRSGSGGSRRSSRSSADRKDYPDFHDLDVRRTLGTGAFGRVKLCSYTPPFGEPKVYALKMLVKKTMVEMKQTHAVLYERKILNQLRHPFILRLHTTYQSRDACYFLLELVQGGELFSRLTTFPDGDFPAEETRFYSAATLLAMEYVHSQNMVYRDLKPENILIDTAGYVRVVDFGFAKRLAGEQPTFTIVGTPEYLSPECALGQGYRMDVDLWAFGVLVFEMLKGNGPFCPADPDDTMAIFKLISDCRIEFSRKETSAFGAPATSLCKELLNRSRKKRLGNLKGGVKNIKDHAYFAGVDFHAILNRRVAAPWNPEVSDPFDTSCFDEYDEAMDIPTFSGDQHAFTEFSDGTIDDSHLVHNVQQQLLPTVH